MVGFSENAPLLQSAPRMSMAERLEKRLREMEATPEALVEDPRAREARIQRAAEVEQKYVAARGRAADLLAELRARKDIPDVPGGGSTIRFSETRGAINARDREITQSTAEQFKAQEARVNASEQSRQQSERLAAEAYRMAMAEKMALERQQYDTRNFDMQGAIRRNTEKLKQQAAQKEGKFAVNG